MKKLLALLLAGASICVSSFAFTACGGGNQGNKNGNIDNPWWSTTGSLEKGENGAVLFDDVDIALSTIVDGEDKTEFNELVAKFNTEYSGKIRVTVTNINQSTFDDTISSQISNNSNPPDLIMAHQKSLKSFADLHLLQPFDETFETSGIAISMNDFSNGLAEYAALGYEGYTFSVPIDAQSCVVYYNKQLLGKYGDELPSTRSELIDLCDRVAKGEGIVPIAWSTEDDFFSDYVFTTAILQNGGYLYGENYRADWYDNASNRTAFQNGIASVREFTTHQPKLATFGLGESSTLNSFLSNKALFFVSMPWYLNSLVEGYAKQNGNLSKDAVMDEYIGAASLENWFAMEEGSADGNIIFGDSHSFAMSRSVKNIEIKAAICEFMKWFTSNGEAGTQWAEAGHISASTVIHNDDSYTSSKIVNNYINKFYPDINHFQCSGVTPYYKDMFESLSSLFVDAKSGGASTDLDNIRTAQDRMNTKIDFIQM